VIESEPRGGTSALLESEVRAREQCTSAAVNRGELEIVLPVDYEILGKCTYVRKSTDGVAPSSKQVEIKNNTYYFVPVINSPSLVHFTYVKRRSADYW